MIESAQPAEVNFSDWREFLTDQPPGARARIDRAAAVDRHINNGVTVRYPELQLYCGKCQELTHCVGSCAARGRLFADTKRESFPAPPSGATDLPYDVLARYTCEVCGWVVKSYSLRFWELAPSADDFGLAEVQKLAEWPAFAPRTPAKLIRLIDSDRELFLKGRRAEIGGLGIGAFSYYRRIIETQKNRLLDEIIRVARHVGASEDAIKTLEAAKEETQFSRAVDSVKDAIPLSLYIKGHNPLTLLHGALSQGLHNESDEACLQAASDIRLILIAFAERLIEAMKEQKELDDALSRLMIRKSSN